MFQEQFQHYALVITLLMPPGTLLPAVTLVALMECMSLGNREE